MEMTSELLFTISSNKDELLISAPKLRLNGGGSCITLDNGGIVEETHGGLPGEIPALPLADGRWQHGHHAA